MVAFSALKEFGVESFIEEMRCACINTRRQSYCFFAGPQPAENFNQCEGNSFPAKPCKKVPKQTAKNREGNWQQFNVIVKIKPSFCCLNTISIYFYSLLCLIFTPFVASLQRDCVIPGTSIRSR